MAEPGEMPRRLEKPKQSILSKARNVLLGLGITAGAGAAIEATAHPIETVVGNTTGAVVRRVEDIQQTGEQIVDVNSGLYGKFLTRQEDGTLTISESPQVVEVKYTPHADPTSQYWNKNNIVVHRKPQADFGEGVDISPDEIKAIYAIRVSGGAYGGQSKVARFQVTYEGREHIVGEWFQPSDEQGTPVNLKGESLQEGEKPYFIAANFVTVQPPLTASQAQGE